MVSKQQEAQGAVPHHPPYSSLSLTNTGKNLIKLSHPRGTTARVSVTAASHSLRAGTPLLQDPQKPPCKPPLRHGPAPTVRRHARLREAASLHSSAKRHKTLRGHTQPTHATLPGKPFPRGQGLVMPTEAMGQTRRRHAAGRPGRAAERPDVPQLWGPTHWKGSSRGSMAVPLRRWQSLARVGVPHPLPLRHPEERWSRPAWGLLPARRQMVVITRTIIPWKFPWAWERDTPSPRCCPGQRFPGVSGDCD